MLTVPTPPFLHLNPSKTRRTLSTALERSKKTLFLVGMVRQVLPGTVVPKSYDLQLEPDLTYTLVYHDVRG